MPSTRPGNATEPVQYTTHSFRALPHSRRTRNVEVRRAAGIRSTSAAPDSARAESQQLSRPNPCVRDGLADGNFRAVLLEKRQRVNVLRNPEEVCRPLHHGHDLLMRLDRQSLGQTVVDDLNLELLSDILSAHLLPPRGRSL